MRENTELERDLSSSLLPHFPTHLCFVSSHVTSFSLNMDPKCSPVSCFLLKPFVLGVVLVRVYSPHYLLEKEQRSFSGTNLGFTTKICSFSGTNLSFTTKILRALILIMGYYDDLRQRQWFPSRCDVPPRGYLTESRNIFFPLKEY